MKISSQGTFLKINKLFQKLKFKKNYLTFKCDFYRFYYNYFMIIIMFIYGFSTEILQKIMNFGRAFEWVDLCADILGVTMGYLVTRLIKIK